MDLTTPVNDFKADLVTFMQANAVDLVFLMIMGIMFGIGYRMIRKHLKAMADI